MHFDDVIAGTDFTLIDEHLLSLATAVERGEHVDELADLLPELGRMQVALDRLTAVALIRCEDKGVIDFQQRSTRARVAGDLGVTGARLSHIRANSAQGIDPTAYQQVCLGVRALLPETARAFAEGAISFTAVNIIRDLMRNIEAGEEWDTIEAELADMARACTPDQLRANGTALIQAYGMGDNKEDREARRNVSLTKQGTDLMSRLGGEADPELASLLERLFADYAGPGDLLDEGAEDNRTPGQRQHDALAQALKYALNEEGPMKPTRGCASVVVSVTLEQLCAMSGVAMTDVGTLITIDEVIKLGASKYWYLSVLDGEGRPLYLGRTSRGASLDQYLALFSSQGGDQTPGSNLPAARTEIHHPHSWGQGGRTDIDNLMFVGHKTHANIDDDQLREDKYWTMKVGDKVLWREPSAIDEYRPLTTNIAPWMWWVPGMQLRYIKKGAPKGPWHVVSGAA